MKQRQLEILLAKVTQFDNPSSILEQYMTPAHVAARLLHLAYMKGDIEGKRVVDLGCGTGILAIGAALLGGVTTGVDSDERALEIARTNARDLHVEVQWIKSSVADFIATFDTVVMNPPFGAQKKHQDRPFLIQAFMLANVVYSIHNAVSNNFVRQFVVPNKITDSIKIKFPIAHTFKFHKKEIEYTDVVLYRIERISC